jgi:hypothetical protein
MRPVASVDHRTIISSYRPGRALEQWHERDRLFSWMVFSVLPQRVWLGIHVYSFRFCLELVDWVVPLCVMMMMGWSKMCCPMKIDQTCLRREYIV